MLEPAKTSMKSNEGTVLRQAVIYQSVVCLQAMLPGGFTMAMRFSACVTKKRILTSSRSISI